MGSHLIRIVNGEMMHVCPQCEEEKARSEFYLKKNIQKKNGLRARATPCKECLKRKKKDNYEFYRDKQENWRLKNFYGIDKDEYNRMLEAQGGTCLICKKSGHIRRKNSRPIALAVDHNHETGKIRGLLCINCNSGIGKLGDSITMLKKAIKYLEETDEDHL